MFRAEGGRMAINRAFARSSDLPVLKVPDSGHTTILCDCACTTTIYHTRLTSGQICI